VNTDFHVEDFGARGDGKAVDTLSVQAAIDAAHANGGGRVALSPGSVYLCGSLELRSNVEFHLTGGSVLLASSELSDYKIIQKGVVQMDEPPSEHSTALTGSLIYARGARNVSISGGGTIDGNGHKFVESISGSRYWPRKNRIFAIHLVDTESVVICDLALVNNALWTINLSRCDDIVIRGVRISNNVDMPNSDGINLDACRRALISGCNISTGDDAICLKASIGSTHDGRSCEDIIVSDCILSSSSSAVLLGVECATAIRNVIVSNCIIKDSNRGLAVSLREEGTIERVRFQNILVETRLFDEHWWGHGEPIYVSAAPRNTKVGRIRDVSFREIFAVSPRGVFLWADREGRVEDIRISESTIRLTSNSPYELCSMSDIRPVLTNGVFPDRIAAIRVHNVKGLVIRGLDVRYEAHPYPQDAEVFAVSGVSEFDIGSKLPNSSRPLVSSESYRTPS
jgi:hypothetical protein